MKSNTYYLINLLALLVCSAPLPLVAGCGMSTAKDQVLPFTPSTSSAEFTLATSRRPSPTLPSNPTTSRLQSPHAQASVASGTLSRTPSSTTPLSNQAESPPQQPARPLSPPSPEFLTISATRQPTRQTKKYRVYPTDAPVGDAEELEYPPVIAYIALRVSPKTRKPSPLVGSSRPNTPYNTEQE